MHDLIFWRIRSAHNITVTKLLPISIDYVKRVTRVSYTPRLFEENNLRE